jgi:aminopeptidase N
LRLKPEPARLRSLATFAFAALLLAGCATMPSADAPAPALTTAPLAASVTSDLPRTARPLHYRIDFVPDAQNMTFAGTESIDLEIFERIDALTLQALNLDVTAARMFRADGTGGTIPLEADIDNEMQTLRLKAPRPIEPGAYRVDLSYDGKILTQPSGLFALDYPDKRTGETVRGLFTQFEAPDARRFAPMFDEPSYKATFDLSATVPANLMAVSNMPVAGEETLPGARKRVTFRTTPKMSSYLLLFALGDFERLSAKGPNGVDVGIVSPAGSGEQARFALDMLPPLLGYYGDYFGVPFPLPKLDNIAAPGQSQSFGAMENWGAILTFEKYLLVDPAITSPAVQDYMYTAQAHEVAHQWFGDIVTMAWWDGLWLNEGFASWMETKASDHFHPEWFPLLTRVNGRERAMALDSFATTHPVIQAIHTVEESNTAFDQIAYSKGEAVIAMLEAYAGEEVWRDGIRAYIREHQYGNTTSDDLWRAVEQAGATGLTQIAHDFTLQPGVPLVRAEAACRGGQTALTLTQSEFSRDRKDAGAAQPHRWRVPLLIEGGSARPLRQVLDGSASLTLPGCGAVVVNGGQLGYFRTLYTSDMIAKLAQALPSLAPIDQLGLVRDSFALAEGDYQPLAPAMALLTAIPANANPVVAQGAVERWAAMHGVAGEADRPRVASMAQERLLPRLRQLGFEPRPNDTLAEANLRADLITALGNMGDETVAGEARRRFAALATDPRAMDGPLKTTWLAVAARNATAAEWERLLELARASSSTVERQAYFQLLGAAQDPALAQRALDFALTGEAGTTSPNVITAVAAEHADLAYDYAMSNRARVEALIDTFGQASFISALAVPSRDPAMIGKLEQFRDSLPADQRRLVERRIAALRQRQESEPRLSRQLGEWLATR